MAKAKGIDPDSKENKENQDNQVQNKVQQEADDTHKELLDAFNDLNSDNLGIVDNTAEKQAKMLIAGTKMVGAFTKLGVYKFADLINNIAQKGIQITDELLSAIKKAYGAFSAENDIDELDEMKTVRAFKLSDVAKNKDAEISETEEEDSDEDEELNNKTAEQIIADLNLDEENFPHLNSWEDKNHLLRTLQGIAKTSGCNLETAALNLELDLSMM
ncbi:MAG: hypothetical protein WCR29_06825 [Bacteroidales bacterium]